MLSSPWGLQGLPRSWNALKMEGPLCFYCAPQTDNNINELMERVSIGGSKVVQGAGKAVKLLGKLLGGGGDRDRDRGAQEAPSVPSAARSSSYGSMSLPATASVALPGGWGVWVWEQEPAVLQCTALWHTVPDLPVRTGQLLCSAAVHQPQLCGPRDIKAIHYPALPQMTTLRWAATGSAARVQWAPLWPCWPRPMAACGWATPAAPWTAIPLRAGGWAQRSAGPTSRQPPVWGAASGWASQMACSGGQALAGAR